MCSAYQSALEASCCQCRLQADRTYRSYHIIQLFTKCSSQHNMAPQLIQPNTAQFIQHSLYSTAQHSTASSFGSGCKATLTVLRTVCQASKGSLEVLTSTRQRLTREVCCASEPQPHPKGPTVRWRRGCTTCTCTSLKTQFLDLQVR